MACQHQSRLNYNRAHTKLTRDISGNSGSGDQGDCTREESHRTLVAYGNSTKIRRQSSST